ncbi:MAG: hypothetical protein VR66_05445 [Peptococcaceae bacterium BRH_c23]|nr:MAG: hypothetical protein VR66_05445 [Peptococcaceae bacterium BRH_c23]KJS79192.1 MAG: hypothetical protein JL57_30260 [Desulfosporosinus sp. BICA1-9]
MKVRQQCIDSPLFEDISKVYPIVDETGSDSAMFDSSLEFLHLTGRSLPHAVMMMIPEPWEKNELMSKEKKDFYEFNNFIMEPWDGPAAMGFSDGVVIGGVLDRNGLRPSRYYITKDDRVILASEDKVFTAGDMRRGQSLIVWALQEGKLAAREVDKYLMGKSVIK